MSLLLTDEELKDAVRKLFITPEAHEMAMSTSLDEYRLIVAAVIKKLAGVSVEPVAHLKFWAAQRVSPDGGVEADEGLEVCRAGDVGVDGVLAEPVYTAEALAAARVQMGMEAAAICDRNAQSTSADEIRALIGGNHG